MPGVPIRKKTKTFPRGFPATGTAEMRGFAGTPPATARQGGKLRFPAAFAPFREVALPPRFELGSPASEARILSIEIRERMNA